LVQWLYLQTLTSMKLYGCLFGIGLLLSACSDGRMPLSAVERLWEPDLPCVEFWQAQKQIELRDSIRETVAYYMLQLADRDSVIAHFGPGCPQHKDMQAYYWGVAPDSVERLKQEVEPLIHHADELLFYPASHMGSPPWGSWLICVIQKRRVKAVVLGVSS
jgi:hypothetical protein